MNYRVVRDRKLVDFLVGGIFLLCLASSSFAQRAPTGPPPGAGPPPNNNPNLQDRFRQVDEAKLRGAEMNAVSDESNEKRLQAAILNMKEDFTRIQVLRNDIARSLVARKPIDHKLVSEQTAEINKRARRLNVYMRAHVADDEKQNDSTKSEEIIDALVRLCKLIDSFTENPALKNASTLDLKESGKAGKNKANADRDLLAIVKLSAMLQQKSEKLRASQ